MAQHPNSMKAWSHNALRGSTIRAQRSIKWLLNYIRWGSVGPTDRARQLADQINTLFNELIEELRIRKD